MVLTADTRALRKLGAELRTSKRPVYLKVRRATLAVAKVIAEDAKSRASWSTRIPGSIKATTANGGLTAVVRAGGKAAPNAAPFEHAGREGTFRHPVFADATKTRSDWTWVSQQARPFLHPATMDHLTEAVEAIRDAVILGVNEHIDKA